MTNFRNIPEQEFISSIDDLLAIYPEPAPNTGQMIKELDHLCAPYQTFIEHSPFVIVATSGKEGLDCTPRGDPAGFVRVLDDKHLALPDRRGNNRVDSLRNLIENSKISLLFMIPGHNNTLRVNGHARITINEDFCSEFIVQQKKPQSVILIEIDKVYVQCAKALMRSKLWQSIDEKAVKALPTVGDMMNHITKGKFDGKTYDANYPKHAQKTIY
jgi:PPOX class probable FMN-dependent enzyme